MELKVFPGRWTGSQGEREGVYVEATLWAKHLPASCAGASLLKIGKGGVFSGGDVVTFTQSKVGQMYTGSPPSEAGFDAGSVWADEHPGFFSEGAAYWASVTFRAQSTDLQLEKTTSFGYTLR